MVLGSVRKVLLSIQWSLLSKKSLKDTFTIVFGNNWVWYSIFWQKTVSLKSTKIVKKVQHLQCKLMQFLSA